MKKLIIASIFLVPMSSILQMPGTIVWYPQYMAMIALGFALVSMLIWDTNKPLSILSLYCLYSYIFVCHQHPRAMLCLIAAYAGIGLICLVSKMNTVNIYKAIIGISILQFVLVILQKINLDPFFHSIANQNLSDTVGFVGSHNQLGIYYALVAPILFHFCLPLLLISILSIYFSVCSSAAIGTIVSLCLYAFLMRIKWMIWVLIPLIAISAFLMHRFDNIEEITLKRMNLWKKTACQSVQGKVDMNMGNGVHHIVTTNPLTGFGLGSFMMVSPKSQGEELFGKGYSYDNTPRWEHAHDDLVEYLFEFGYLGLIIIAFLIYDILAKFIHSVRTNRLVVCFCALVAIAISSCGVYVIHAPVSYFMLCLILGLFYAEVNYARKSFTQTTSIT